MKKKVWERVDDEHIRIYCRNCSNWDHPRIARPVWGRCDVISGEWTKVNGFCDLHFRDLFSELFSNSWDDEWAYNVITEMLSDPVIQQWVENQSPSEKTRIMEWIDDAEMQYGEEK